MLESVQPVRSDRPSGPSRPAIRILSLSRRPDVADKLAISLGDDYRVVHTAELREAIRHLRRVKPDLVVVGPHVPVLEAQLLFQSVRSLDASKQTGFVMLISRPDPDLMNRAYESGVDLVLSLPATADTVANHLRATHARMQLGSEFDDLLTPDRLPTFEGYQTDYYRRPLSPGGGDLMTWFEAPDGSFYVAIADVEGKGIRAGSFAFAYQGYIRSAILTCVDQGRGAPSEVLSVVNRLATSDPMLEGKHFSIVLMRWDRENHLVSYANAGHCEPLLLSSTRTGFRKTGDIPVGLRTDTVFHDEILSLGPGEAILLYTDGLTELRSSGGALSGTELLTTIARESATVQDLAESLLATSGRQHFDDDVMIFRLRRNRPSDPAAV